MSQSNCKKKLVVSSDWQHCSVKLWKKGLLVLMSVIPAPWGAWAWLPPTIGSCSPRWGQACILSHGAMMTVSRAQSRDIHRLAFSNLSKLISVHKKLCWGRHFFVRCTDTFCLWGSSQPYKSEHPSKTPFLFSYTDLPVGVEARQFFP